MLERGMADVSLETFLPFSVRSVFNQADRVVVCELPAPDVWLNHSLGCAEAADWLLARKGYGIG